MNNTIIVIGASSGGFQAIQTLVAGLPRTLPASIFVVWHMSPDMLGVLPYVLNKLDTLPASNAVDGETIEPGRIYVAPPDHHLLVEESCVRVTRGPKENRFRPAVDPLFRSAAFTFRTRVIGIVLSGALGDGTSGLWLIKHFGGRTIVQHPRDATVPSMPESALREVEVDHVVPVSEMPGLLERLCAEPLPQEPKHISIMDEQRTEKEIKVAKGDKEASEGIMQLGELSPYACPECHGVLSALREGERIRYRCHTGHAYSAESLLASVTEAIDDSLWNAIRAIEESIMMLNLAGDHHADQNDPRLAAQYFQKATEARQRLVVLQELVTKTEELSKEQIERERGENPFPE